MPLRLLLIALVKLHLHHQAPQKSQSTPAMMKPTVQETATLALKRRLLLWILTLVHRKETILIGALGILVVRDPSSRLWMRV
jgi:hypothetical protein